MYQYSIITFQNPPCFTPPALNNSSDRTTTKATALPTRRLGAAGRLRAAGPHAAGLLRPRPCHLFIINVVVAVIVFMIILVAISVVELSYTPLLITGVVIGVPAPRSPPYLPPPRPAIQQNLVSQ